MTSVVSQYLNLLDNQREAAFAALAGISPQVLWQRPAPREWSLGEILDHNFLLINSTFPYVRLAWALQQRRAERRRSRPYPVEIADPYRKPTFPMWVGFLWKPRYTPSHPVPLEALFEENRRLHAAVRAWYAAREPDLLGNVFVYDPLFGSINLIITLRIGIHHDQLHFDDVFARLAERKP